MFYQQPSRIDVYVMKGSADTGTEGAKETDSVSGDIQAPNSADNTPNQRISNRRFISNITHIYATARQVGNLAINYRLQGLGYETGDQSYQEIQQRQWEIYQDATSVTSSIGMGLTYGSFGGLPGMVIGAILGGISAGASLISKYSGRRREYSVKMFKENNRIAYQRARASINATTGRLR